MSQDVHTVEDLTAIYMGQSPSAFTLTAMEAHQPNDHSKRVDEQEHGGDSKCNYPCCNDRGYCSSPAWYACMGGCVVVCCVCCCYLTNGFNGVWTYWPN